MAALVSPKHVYVFGDTLIDINTEGFSTFRDTGDALGCRGRPVELSYDRFAAMGW